MELKKRYYNNSQKPSDLLKLTPWEFEFMFMAAPLEGTIGPKEGIWARVAKQNQERAGLPMVPLILVKGWAKTDS